MKNIFLAAIIFSLAIVTEYVNIHVEKKTNTYGAKNERKKFRPY